MRRRTRGNEWRWLELIARVEELIARVEEGTGGSHRPFIGARGHRRGVAAGSNGGINGFNAIEDGGEVKRGLRGGGNDGGASNGSGGIRG
jgi:hypothetical protein